MTAIYPSALPYPRQQGYALRHVSPMIRTEMQSGRARQRRTFTSVPSMVSVSWFFNEREAMLFEGWFRDNGGAGDGAEWFQMPLQTPIGTRLYDCRFSEMYDGPELIAFNNWIITATLEIRERPILDDGWASILPDYILLSDIFDKAMNEQWPEHQFWRYRAELDMGINQEWPED